MDRHLKAHLYDISTAVDEVQSFFNIVPRRFDEYCGNLMHDYAAVTDDVMWKIVINDLPKLKIEVDTLLAKE